MRNDTTCAVARSDEIVIADTQSALDLPMTAKYALEAVNSIAYFYCPFIQSSSSSS